MTYADFMTSVRLDLGRTTLTDMDKARLTQWLNESLTDAWTKPEWQMWPWIVDVVETALVDYRVAFSGLNDSEVWTVWSQDPREKFASSQAVAYYQLRAVRDGSDLCVQAQSATADVVIFVRTACPSYVVDDVGTDEFPDVFVPWVKAMMRVKMLDYGMASQSEATLTKAYAREDSEYQKLIYQADRTWVNAPWLSALNNPT